jgi:hypothetical protein
MVLTTLHNCDEISLVDGAVDTDPAAPGAPKGRNMKLAILIKSVYGNTLYYPFNDAARALAGIAGKKTFSAKDLQIAYTQLGFEIEYVDAASFLKPELLLAA